MSIYMLGKTEKWVTSLNATTTLQCDTCSRGKDYSVGGYLIR